MLADDDSTAGHAGLYVISGDRCYPRAVCIGFRLQTLGLCGTLPSLVVFKFRFFERVTIVVIAAGHIESFPRWGGWSAPSLTMKHALLCSSIDHGGGKRRGADTVRRVAGCSRVTSHPQSRDQ
jgi:hypothetical protein